MRKPDETGTKAPDMGLTATQRKFLRTGDPSSYTTGKLAEKILNEQVKTLDKQLYYVINNVQLLSEAGYFDDDGKVQVGDDIEEIEDVCDSQWLWEDHWENKFGAGPTIESMEYDPFALHNAQKHPKMALAFEFGAALQRLSTDENGIEERTVMFIGFFLGLFSDVDADIDDLSHDEELEKRTEQTHFLAKTFMSLEKAHVELPFKLSQIQSESGFEAWNRLGEYLQKMVRLFRHRNPHIQTDPQVEKLINEIISYEIVKAGLTPTPKLVDFLHSQITPYSPSDKQDFLDIQADIIEVFEKEIKPVVLPADCQADIVEVSLKRLESKGTKDVRLRLVKQLAEAKEPVQKDEFDLPQSGKYLIKFLNSLSDLSDHNRWGSYPLVEKSPDDNSRDGWQLTNHGELVAQEYFQENVREELHRRAIDTIQS